MSRDPHSAGIQDTRLHSASLFVVLSIRDKKRPHSHGKSSDSSANSFLTLMLDSRQVANAVESRLVHESRNLNGPLWEQASEEGLRASEDLSPAVLRALGGTPHGEAMSEGVPGIKLTAKGIRLINGGYAAPGGNPAEWSPEDKLRYRSGLSGLSIKLTNAAQRRLTVAGVSDSPQELFVTVEQVFAIFPSQYCTVVAELKISAWGPETFSPLVIEEALHILSKRGKIGECGFASITESPGIDLHDLLESTVPERRFEIDDRFRIFYYAVLVLEAFPDDTAPIEELAFRCARHYTTDYDNAKGEVSKSLYRPFESVIHAFALEGAASVANGSDHFLREQFLTRVRQVYLWLVALAYHEQSYLLGLVFRENFVSGNTEHRSQRFRALIDDFLEFRLRHRMPLVSHIEMHNQAYHALRQNLRLDELIHKVTQDVVEAERWLTQQIEHRHAEQDRLRKRERERRKAWRHKFARWEALVSAFLMFGLTYLSFDALTHKLAMLKWGADLLPPWNFVVPFVVACVAAGLRGWQVIAEIREDPIFDAEQEMTTTGEAADLEKMVGVASTRDPH